MADGMVEVARATVTIVPNTRGAEKSITDALVPAAGDAGAKAGEKSGTGLVDGIKGVFNSTIGNLKSAIAGGGTDLGGVLSSSLASAAKTLLPVALALAVGGALIGIGEQFEEVENTIIIGTGASGEALETMAEDVKAVTDSIPAGLGAASQTIADLNTRMGISGPIAEDLARNILEVGKMTGEAINVNELTGMFNQFGISGDMAVDKMNVMWAVSQNTGLGFNQLASTLKNSAGQLQMLGFSFEESAAMAGALDKAGIDASGVMSKMSKALATLAKDGEEPQQAFKRVTDEISAFIAEGNDAAAIDLSAELFGTRGATQFVNAVKSGALEMSNLTDVTKLAGGNIDETAQQTMTLGDKMSIMGNKVTNSLQQLGTLLLGVVTPAVDALSGGLDAMTGLFGSLVDGITAGLQPAFAAIEPVVNGITEAFTGATGEGGILNGIFAAIGNTLGFVGTIIGTIVSFIVAQVVPGIQLLISVLSPIIGLVMGIVSTVMFVVEQITGFISALLQTIVNFVTGSEDATAPLEAFFANLWGNICVFAQGLWDGFLAFIAGIPASIGSFFASLPGVIGGLMQSAGAYVISALSSARDSVAGIPGQIAGFFADLPGKIWEFISSIPGKFVEVFSQIHVPTFHLSGEFDLNPAHFRLPTIEFYATGGLVTEPTYAMLAEAGYGEYVVPRQDNYLSKLARDLVSFGFGSGSGGKVEQNFEINANDPYLVAAVVAQRQRNSL